MNNFILKLIILLLIPFTSFATTPSSGAQCGSLYNGRACQVGGIYGNVNNCQYNVHRNNGIQDSTCLCACISPDGVNLGSQHQWWHETASNSQDCQKNYNGQPCQSGST